MVRSRVEEESEKQSESEKESEKESGKQSESEKGVGKRGVEDIKTPLLKRGGDRLQIDAVNFEIRGGDGPADPNEAPKLPGLSRYTAVNLNQEWLMLLPGEQV